MTPGPGSEVGSNSRKSGTDEFVGRMMEILHVIQNSGEPPRLSEISRRAGLPKSTVHRLLAKLTEHGLVRRCADRYTLGVAMWRLAADSRSEVEFLRRAIKPVLVQLYSRTGYIVGLAVPEDLTVKFIDTVYDETYVSEIEQIERNSRLADSAAGKVFLAYDRHLASGYGFRSEDDLPPAMENELSAIRSREISTTSTRAGAGINAAAIPIFDAGRHPVAAVSLGAYADRFQPGLAQAMLRRASEHVSLLTRRHAVRNHDRLRKVGGK
ncbi:IclR family transcriptional regulator [Amycolatopsis thailandensis]|uniref:IclR family transcriptional regulator n=1 Tax=Amycolatopsis thailandensis TaxID=589330 RepID=UPI00378C8A18